ncbi:vanadium-dependent haloperoxidase [Micromonospora zhanjiangensis]
MSAGRTEARSLLGRRADDGLDPASVNPTYPAPAAEPGVWQPTPPTFTPAQQAGTRFARPFLLDRADRYRPGPPPALTSARYRADLAEVRAYGAADSTVRTPAQTDTATFWLGSSLTIYTGILRAALARSTRPIAERVTLVALFHVALVDTQIATSDTKYAYLRWRPVTAIRAGDDPTWTPLHTTPAHPDYPSGHNTYAGAAEGVLTALVGPRARQPYTVTSPSQPGVTRTYTDWRGPTRENGDARVWSGIHTRTADEVGVRLGRDVAAHTVRNAYRLFG